MQLPDAYRINYRSGGFEVCPEEWMAIDRAREKLGLMRMSIPVNYIEDGKRYIYATEAARDADLTRCDAFAVIEPVVWFDGII